MQLETTNIAEPDEVTFSDYLNILKKWFSFILKKWWIIAIVGLVGGGLGFWYASRDKAKYESKLTFALDDGGTEGGSGAAGLAAQFGFSIGGGSKNFFSGENILEIMKSRRIVENVLLTVDTIEGKSATMIEHFFHLSQDEKNNLLTKKNVHFPIGGDKSKFTYLQDSILLVTANMFSKEYIKAQKPDKKLDIYEVKVSSLDEKFTKIFTDRIVQETINFYTELRIKKSKKTLDILEQRVASMKGNLNYSITARTSIQDANLNPAFAAAQAPIQKQQADIQVYGTAYGEMFKNLEVARFQFLKEIPLLQIIDAADYPMKRIKMGKLSTAIEGGMLFSFLIILIITLFRKNNHHKAPTNKFQNELKD